MNERLESSFKVQLKMPIWLPLGSICGFLLQSKDASSSLPSSVTATFPSSISSTIFPWEGECPYKIQPLLLSERNMDNFWAMGIGPVYHFQVPNKTVTLYWSNLPFSHYHWPMIFWKKWAPPPSFKYGHVYEWYLGLRWGQRSWGELRGYLDLPEQVKNKTTFEFWVFF